MKRSLFVLAAVILVNFSATAVHAQCIFGYDSGDVETSRGPAPAKGIKLAMVRSYAACPSAENPTGNATTTGGLDACVPVRPPQNGGLATEYNYGPKGRCTVSLKAKLEKDCSAVNPALPSTACQVTYVQSKCSDVRKADGTGLIDAVSDDNWGLLLNLRVSGNDRIGGDMTTIDLPLRFRYSAPLEGEMEIDSNTAEVLLAQIGAETAAIPACASVEIVSAAIVDPDDLIFAKPGLATVPK